MAQSFLTKYVNINSSDNKQAARHDFLSIISRHDMLGTGVFSKTSKVDQLVSILKE
jgi:hypothetical protein